MLIVVIWIVSFFSVTNHALGQKLKVNDLEYFETPGVNI
jgi:hypothetical protein